MNTLRKGQQDQHPHKMTSTTGHIMAGKRKHREPRMSRAPRSSKPSQVVVGLCVLPRTPHLVPPTHSYREGTPSSVPISPLPRPASPVRSVGTVFPFELPSTSADWEPHPSVVLVPGGGEGSSRPPADSPSTVNSTPVKRPRVTVKYKQQRLWGAPPPGRVASLQRDADPEDEAPPKTTGDVMYDTIKHRYESEWRNKFKWLRLIRLPNGLAKLKCDICVQHGDPTAHTSYGAKGEGGRDFQIGSVRAHSATRAHKNALKAQAEAGADKAKQVSITRWQATDASTRHIICVLHIAVFVCKADAPIAMFIPLCWFLAKEGLPDLPNSGGYGAYYTEYGFRENLRAISAYLQEVQRLHLLESPWIGLSLDESSDRVNGKHLILYATFFRGTAVVTEFLTLITVDRADAASLTSAVVQYLTGIGLDLQKMSSVSTDGANVMMGKHTGVVARLRMRIPHLASTHCVAHR
ncbi:unnamed protein product, partial [Closterium sp. NIES-53]